MANASLSFLAWVRQGAASAIKTDDTPGGTQPGVTTVAAKLTLNGGALPEVQVRLRGPADVLGIDPNQVLRTDPRPAALDFESNCFPSIEFDRPDFPWLFTPARANPSRQLRPWLCLVAVARQSGVSLDTPAGATLPVLRIAGPAKPGVELPDLKDAWAWAHAQVAADTASRLPVGDALNGGPELSLSRLVCPRILAPDTEYLACVVPTFDLGRRSGLGLPVTDADVAAADALKPAWLSGAAAPTEALLPVYYHWEFRTGPGGDFQSIVSGLTPDLPDGLGRRTIDISRPGFNPGGATTAELEGALKPIHPPGGAAPPDSLPPPAFQTTLAGLLNAPAAAAAGTDPVLAPPIYGRWHAGRPDVGRGDGGWLDELNLDPRWRVTAAYGTRVVQTHQEALMASAWEQAAELQVVNQRLRQLQVSRSVGEVLHDRHFSKLSDEAMLRVAAPALGRLGWADGGGSMLATQARSRLPMGANRSAMRRIGRPRGPLTRRIAAQGVTRSDTPTWVARMMAPTPPPGPPASPPAPDFSTWPAFPTAHLFADSYWGAFFVAPETAAPTFPGDPLLVSGRTETPGFFRAAAVKHLAGFFPARPPQPHAAPVVDLAGIKDQVLSELQPRDTLRALAEACISTADTVLAAAPPGHASTGLETVMAAPRFPTPMYEPLRDLSQDLLLPGLETVRPETVLGLATNRRFIEAYLVGLNHEMGRELLWRGFPTDQRGTCFTHFWKLDAARPDAGDIADLTDWRDHPLGGSPGAAPSEEFVMLLRSRLLARYPNAVIYMTPAVPGLKPGVVAPNPDPKQEVMPIFSGALKPDLAFLGFPVATRVAVGDDGGLGYFLVIQEHPTEPRFGLNFGATAAGVSHLVVGGPLPTGLIAWGKTASEMAGLTRRRPARVAIHARRLITHAA
jgi:hypothetical protein